MVPNTRREAETETCKIKTQITKNFVKLISHEYGPYTMNQEGLRWRPANRSSSKPPLER